MLRRAGTKPVRLPRRSPNLNAFIERFIRSIKEDCLDRGSARIKVLAVRLSSRPTNTLQMARWSGGSDSVACSTITTEKPREFGTIQ